MPELSKDLILSGRQAVDAYREAHRLLHEQIQDKSVHKAHTPLMEEMKSSLKKLGFNSVSEFFDASRELNIKELGFEDKTDFEKNSLDADQLLLEEKWR